MKNDDKRLEGFVQVRPGVWHRDPPGDDPFHFTQVDVATILKDRRKQVGMTMEQLAEKIGVNKSTISRLEAGQIEKLSSDKLAPIAEALRCSPLYLIGMIDTPYPEEELEELEKHSTVDRKLALLTEEQYEMVMSMIDMFIAKNQAK